MGICANYENCKNQKPLVKHVFKPRIKHISLLQPVKDTGLLSPQLTYTVVHSFHSEYCVQPCRIVFNITILYSVNTVYVECGALNSLQWCSNDHHCRYHPGEVTNRHLSLRILLAVLYIIVCAVHITLLKIEQCTVHSLFQCSFYNVYWTMYLVQPSLHISAMWVHKQTLRHDASCKIGDPVQFSLNS